MMILVHNTSPYNFKGEDILYICQNKQSQILQCIWKEKIVYGPVLAETNKE